MNVSEETFKQIPSRIQQLFYIWAIYCNSNKIGKQNICNVILNSYSHLLLQAGINGRKEICGQAKIDPAQYIPDHLKGTLKSRKIQHLINDYNIPIDSVYFYDDTPEVINIVYHSTGVNAILVNNLSPEYINTLVRKQKFDPNSVRMILLDFDNTITTCSFRKRWLEKTNIEIIQDHLGGIERIKSLFSLFKDLEQKGVKIGIITCQTSDLVYSVLNRIGWLI